MKITLAAVCCGLGLSCVLAGSVLPAQAESGEVIQNGYSDYVSCCEQDAKSAEPLQEGLAARHPEPKVGKIYQELRGDLDGDGRIERVALIPFLIKEYDAFMQLVVFSDDGRKIWSSPRVPERGNNMVFGVFDTGSHEMQLLYDLDKDGRMELICSTPRSDVRPDLYQVLKWDGDQFVTDFHSSLIRQETDRSLFLWKKWDRSGGPVCWVQDLHKENGQIKGDVVWYDRRTTVKTGKAVFDVGRYGVRVSRWIKNLR